MNRAKHVALPPLPAPDFAAPTLYHYTADAMSAYAAEAVRVALGEPIAWLAHNRAGHLFIINGYGPHDVFGGFPVYRAKDRT